MGKLWMLGLGTVTVAAGLAVAVAAPLPAQGLEDRVVRAADGAVHFHFPARAGVCGDGDGIGIRRADGDWTMMRSNWNMRGDFGDWQARCQPGPVQVELRVRDGSVEEIETRVGATPRGGTDLGAVPAAEAVDYLLSLARRVRDSDLGEDALLPAALAEAPNLPSRLLALADEDGVPGETRAQGVFWAAELGADLPALKRVFDRVEDEEVREAVLFAWGRRDEPAAAAELLRVARGDGPSDLREKAVFWLGQSAGRTITADLDAIVEDDGVDDEVREQAVFALSQRPRDEGIPALLRIARTHPSREIRKKALFWLGESGDPRAVALFEEMLIR